MSAMSHSALLTMFNRMIAEQSFYLKRVSDGATIPVHGINPDGKFITADAEGFRQLVEAHTEGCSCGEEMEYIIPTEVLEDCREQQQERAYAFDYKMLEAHKARILNPYFPEYEKGDYVVYADEIYLDSETDEYKLPPRGSLILVSGIRRTATEMYVMEGYTTLDGEIILVGGEAWRFTKHNPEA